jgi:hypothetical protein
MFFCVGGLKSKNISKKLPMFIIKILFIITLITKVDFQK